jgi:hypothetical protein
LLRLIGVLTIIAIAVCPESQAIERPHKYVDIPFFNILPKDSISDVFKLFGPATISSTPLAHSYALYYDYVNKIGLIFYIYQVDNQTLWRLTICKENEFQKLHEYASMKSFPLEKIEVNKPEGVSLPKVLTKRGLKFGMSEIEVEAILKTKLPMKDNEAHIGWDERKGGEIIDYGSLHLRFWDGKLTSISWYGVDP